MAARLTDLSVLALRKRVHEYRERGYSTQQICDRTGLGSRCVERYAAMPKPVLVTPRAGFGWQEEAACLGKPTEWFFPDASAMGQKSANKRLQAKMVCGSCSVRRDCHNFAVGNFERNGVWGGRDFSRASYQHDPVSGAVTVSGGVDAEDAEVG